MGFVPRVQLHVFLRVKPEGRHATAQGVQSHTPLKVMVQLTCAIGELASFVHCKITAFASSTVTDSIPKQNQDQPPPVRPRRKDKASVVVTTEVTANQECGCPS